MMRLKELARQIQRGETARLDGLRRAGEELDRMAAEIDELRKILGLLGWRGRDKAVEPPRRARNTVKPAVDRCMLDRLHEGPASTAELRRIVMALPGTMPSDVQTRLQRMRIAGTIVGEKRAGERIVWRIVEETKT